MQKFAGSLRLPALLFKHVKVTIGSIRRLIREALERANQQAWVPGRWMPGPGEPVEPGELDEVDTDPSNNPGRPADAFEYLGMHPKPTAAMSHPAAAGPLPSTVDSGGSSSPAGGTAPSASTGAETDAATPDEPGEKTGTG